MNLFKKIRDWDYSYLYSDKPWVIVVPTYAWRIPRIVHEWLLKTELAGNRNIYFVINCLVSSPIAERALRHSLNLDVISRHYHYYNRSLFEKEVVTN